MSRRNEEENVISDFRPYPHSTVPHPDLHPGGRSPIEAGRYVDVAQTPGKYSYDRGISAGRYVDGIGNGDWNLIHPIQKRRGTRVDIDSSVSAGRYVDGISGGISAVPVPTPLFAGAIGLVLGVLIGPALLASTAEGSKYLEKQARKRLG